ncbi:MAG: site-specific integrase [Acidimicrobiales bacterium]|nr:site-specific integrase [Acidimicrobiales bacterium]
MRGSVIKRGKRWSIVVDVGRDEKGRRKQKWHSGYATRKAAEDALPDILKRLQAGEYVAPSKLTLGEFLTKEWLPAIRATVRPSTFVSYQMHVATHIKPRIGNLSLQRVSGAALNGLYAELLVEGRTSRKKAPDADKAADAAKSPPARTDLSPATVRRVHATLHRAFRDAVRWHRLTRNPADLADPPKQRAGGSPEMATWTADELRSFLDSVAGDRLVGMWTLFATTGMRRGEVLGLRWSDVDLEAARLSIRQTLVAIGYEARYSTPKTAKGRRVVALDPTTVAALKAHRARQLEDRMALGAGWPDHGLVFTREDGSWVHPDACSQFFEKLVGRTKLPRIRLHDLRHTHATLALAAGVHPKVVSERLGHSTVSMTLDIYSHAVPAMQEDAADKVAALVFGL